MDPQRRPAWSPFFNAECAVAVHSRPTLKLMISARQVIMRQTWFAILAVLILFPHTASALSCYGVNDRFFLKCSEDRCEVSFRAREIPSFGACARRVVVEAVAPDTQDVLLTRIGRVKSGLYEVTLVHRFYSKPPVNASELQGAFNVHELRAPRLTVRELASDTNFDALREQWESQSRKDGWALAGYWGIELLLLFVALYVTYRTTSAYRKRFRTKMSRRFIGPVLLQFCVFIVGLLSLSSQTGPALVGLIAPVLLLVWLYELVAYLLQRFVRRPVNEF